MTARDCPDDLFTGSEVRPHTSGCEVDPIPPLGQSLSEVQNTAKLDREFIQDLGGQPADGAAKPPVVDRADLVDQDLGLAFGPASPFGNTHT